MIPTVAVNQPRSASAPRVYIARVIVRGEYVEGRGKDDRAALVDLVDRLSERLEVRP